ncbi:T6SS immunity protein Tli4 family protein [Massilia aquatica]|uniref:Tle cognate immunity protein 4 C-terminal domain-containing protein n=1 Tax=Massilia aquatica TaxID=2609000 RepID=A0ABX0M6E0_9BURK|nr:T6SS immunity protein Tli4 family protein [Massilia aquatica]NHZ39139.1 hypothetical protein [Massilia aquatica]
MQRKGYGLVTAIVIMSVAAILGVSGWRENQHKTVVNKMTSKITTVCVGRFLIDIPEGAKIQFSSARVASVNINTWQNYTEKQLLAHIEEQLHTVEGKLNEYELPSLEKNIVVDAVNFKTTILYYGREKPFVEIVNGQKVNGIEEAINVDAWGISGDRGYRFIGKYLASPRSENSVLNVVKRFESRSSMQIPDAPGFCTEEGMVHDPIAAAENESVAMFASIAGHPDVAIRLDTSVNVDRVQDSVLVRDAQNDIKRENPSIFKEMRKGTRAFNGLKGEEVLDKIKRQNGTSAHFFMWASMGKMHDVLSPKLTLELETGVGRPGEKINSSLSDDAVVELWDRVSSSIRLRPVSATKKTTHAAPPADLPLGALAATDRVCPQSGLWECNESGDIQGGKRQFFRAGESMPHAVLLGTSSILNRLRGEQPSHRIATVWKLVAYESSFGAVDGKATPERKPLDSPDPDDSGNPST